MGHSSESAGSEGVYPPGWPEWVFCNKPALEGHLTCGELACDERAARVLGMAYQERIVYGGDKWHETTRGCCARLGGFGRLDGCVLGPAIFNAL